MSTKILVVDDEEHIRTLLAYNLESQGYTCVFAETGVEAIHMAELEMPNLILLDWMMPEMNGTAVCKRLKKNPQTATIPVIMITARSEENDKIKGLDSGADDYITKPFSPNELLARVRAVLRRGGGDSASSVLTYKDLTLDTESYSVLYKGTPITVPKKEFQLLQIFMENPNRVFERDVLLSRIWGGEANVDERTVDVYVKRLRKCLNNAGGDSEGDSGGDASDYIRTIRGVGYGL